MWTCIFTSLLSPSPCSQSGPPLFPFRKEPAFQGMYHFYMDVLVHVFMIKLTRAHVEDRNNWVTFLISCSFSLFVFSFLFGRRWRGTSLSLFHATYGLGLDGCLISPNGLCPPHLHYIHNHILHTSSHRCLFGCLGFNFISSCLNHN